MLVAGDLLVLFGNAVAMEQAEQRQPAGGQVEGLSVLETAKVTGMSESAVKVGVHRGLKALAARIGAKGFGA